MADVVTPEERSQIMRRVRGKNTSPELAVRQLVHQLGLRFRLHRQDLQGTPDLVFHRWRRIVFVHGSWWHGHNCRAGLKRAKSNVRYWTTKLGRNTERDAQAIRALRRDGWRVLVIVECQVGATTTLRSRLRRFFT